MIWFWLLQVTALLCYAVCTGLFALSFRRRHPAYKSGWLSTGLSRDSPPRILGRGTCFPPRSAVALTCWTCCKLHPLMEAFESRVLVCVFLTRVFDHTVIFIAVLHTNHSAAAAASQTDSRSLVWLGFKYNKDQSNLKKRSSRSKIFLLEISVASFLQVSQVTSSYCSLEDLCLVIHC